MFLSRKPGKKLLIDSGDLQALSVDKETFITPATISCTNVILSTHDDTYWQINSLAMRSRPAPSLSNPSLSNIWLCKYEPAIKDDAKLID